MKRKFVVLVVAITLVFGLISGVAAAPVLERISADLNWSVQFVIDGKEWTPRDAEGNQLALITYRGSNYLPVRAIAEALDTAVDWDGNTQTIFLGEKTDSVLITDEAVNTDHSSMVTTDKQFTVQGGQDYTAGIVMESINSAGRKTTLVPGNKYQVLELHVFGIDLNHDVTIDIIGKNDVVLKQINVGSAKSQDTIEVDVGGEAEVLIQAKSSPGAKERLFISGTYR